MTKKQKIAPAAVCVALVAVCFTGGYFYGRHQKLLAYRADATPLPAGFTYTAHTGCVDSKDNSLESIEKGAENGAKIVEFDLNFTADKTPILSHDDPKGGEVTLEQAFEKLSEYETLGANVDVKNTANLAGVQALAEQYGLLDRIFYTGIALSDVEAVRRNSPKIRYFLNVNIEKSKTGTPTISLLLSEPFPTAALSASTSAKSTPQKKSSMPFTMQDCSFQSGRRTAITIFTVYLRLRRTILQQDGRINSKTS